MRRSAAFLAGLVAIAISIAVPIGTAQQARRVDDATLRAAGRTGDEWLTYGLNQAETRYSPLTDINTANVSRLRPVWAYEVGSGGGGQ